MAHKGEVVSVDLESDSKGVIELINNKMGTLTETFWVIFDIFGNQEEFSKFQNSTCT